MLSPGNRLGPYEVLAPLGAGGMGEVYRARDTRLGREVALKVLPASFAEDPARLRRFEREARAAASLSHPNVLTVFDVGSSTGCAFVVTELLEGTTLAAHMRRGPPPPDEALSLAAQAARGLAAAHAQRIVHRDLKPENLFLTTSGTLKILDFGLARLHDGDAARTQDTTQSNATDPGAVLGTLSYMSPEQARGIPVDARSDLFSLGVVLHEMLSGRHPFKRTSSAETVSAILRDEPPELATLDGRLPQGVQRLVRRCLEKRPEDRFQNASDLALALDLLAPGADSARQVSGARTATGEAPGATSEERPYPGLSAFTERDAAHFFGREGEVRALWEKVRHRKLLALIGPSGVGKTSFLRAGLIPHHPPGWTVVYMTPGSSPIPALARAISAVISDEADPDERAVVLELMQGMADSLERGDTARLVSAVARWRARRADALLVMDQFEELFTLCPPDTQELCSTLLGRLVEEADLHVVLSLRDDFLFRCHGHAALAEVFRDVTPLGPPAPPALRRALVEPAARLGVRFEDDALLEEMVGAVVDERAALPLLAFTASRLWEERDRERRLLTRGAYARIGGVAGALAQHAEATLAHLEPRNEAVVREIFRNLVTAQGTRAVLDRDELLSIFDASPADVDSRADGATFSPTGAGPGPPHRSRQAGVVLNALVEARLLTEYDAEGGVQRAAVAADEGGAAQVHQHRQRIEIVHESLLTAWPRLVRWRAQEEEGAILRDQLKQAARLWEEKKRPEELLWTGKAYGEYRVWRGRYTGGLTAPEEAFARAMAERAGRQRRRRRIAAVALSSAASAVAIVTSVLWTRAEAEARRAEGSKLLALAQLERERYPTAALAYAIKSLELSDRPEARLFALGILQEHPTAMVVPPPKDSHGGLLALHPEFSPDGEWLAVGGLRRILLLNRDGRPQRALGDYPTVGSWGPTPAFATVPGRLFSARVGDMRMLSIPDGHEIWRQQVLGEWTVPFRVEDGAVSVTGVGPRLVVRRWPVDGGAPSVLGSVENASTFSFGGSSFVYREGGQVLLRRLSNWSVPIRVGAPFVSSSGEVEISPDGRLVAASDERGEVRIWRVSDDEVHLIRAFTVPDLSGPGLKFDDEGRRLAVKGASSYGVIIRIVAPDGPPGAEPLLLQRTGEPLLNGVDFDPAGRWLAVGTVASTSLWALDGAYPTVFKAEANDLAFAPDGRTLVALERQLRAWPLGGESTAASQVLYEPPGLQFPGIAIDPSGRRAALAGSEGFVAVASLAGHPPRVLRGFSPKSMLHAVAFADGGRLVAAAPFFGPPEEKVVRIWDLETGATRTSGPVAGAGGGFAGAMRSLITLGDQRHAVAGVEGYGLIRVDLRTGAQSVLTREADRVLAWSPAAGVLLACRFDREGEGCSPLLFDPERHTSQPLTTHGGSCAAGAIDPSGTIVATGSFGTGDVRVGPVSGGEPHVLLGHGVAVEAMAFSPDGRWLAVAGDSIRIWPVPDVTRTPLHLRRHDDLMDVLYSHTNLRAVSDETSSTRYRLEPGPFPGWATSPKW
jgi:WD40 repeat protein